MQCEKIKTISENKNRVNVNKYLAIITNVMIYFIACNIWLIHWHMADTFNESKCLQDHYS